MGNWLDFLASFDLLDRIEGLVSSFVHADLNPWRFWVPRAAGWSGIDIERFLRKYGVAIWDRGIQGPDFYFSVKRRQANWAEYLLLRRGIPITGPLFNPDNARYGAQYAPGDAPPAWADRGQQPENPIDKIANWFDY